MAQQKWPIIYVRGYAMTQGEIDETTADPFCGFNLGSTVYRATPDKDRPPRKFVFESPVVRLGLEHGYTGVYDNGFDIVDKDFARKCIPPASIVIFRYYDDASLLLGTGEVAPIDDFARRLGDLILRVRELVCSEEANPRIPEADFRCYLVAHSMGGLVCRAFVQNPACDPKGARRHVDKLFTYGTPHNGIDMAGLNVPSWLKANGINTFNRKTMAAFLNLDPEFGRTKRVDWLPERANEFSAKRVFCMIGTNRVDYEAGMGLSRTFAGHGSDGLVRIENASVWGINAAGGATPCATAYAYRAHSGYFGVVNSEEAYQNLVRFLFGDYRVDIWAEVSELQLPPEVREAQAKNRDVNALYQFEITAAPRGTRWFLTRRIAEEDSVACRTLAQLQSQNPEERSVYLSTVFLSEKAKVKQDRPSLGYAVHLGIRVPDYEIEGRFFGEDHYEGGALFRDTVEIELFPPQAPAADWRVVHIWKGSNVRQEFAVTPQDLKNGTEFKVKFAGDRIAGQLRFRLSAWS